MHANFSTAYMREVGGEAYFAKLMQAFEEPWASTRRRSATLHQPIVQDFAGEARQTRAEYMNPAA